MKKEKNRESVFLKPTFSKAVAGFTAARSEAGYGFRKSRISQSAFVEFGRSPDFAEFGRQRISPARFSL
jgi:hypothetical protein